jgi:hypothetical protein
MYNVIAERIDPYDGKPRIERTYIATSFECVPQQVTGKSIAKVWLEDGTQETIPVSGRESDFQYVIVYGANGEVVQYMKVVSGTVGVHLGPTVDRS